jgi:hypothetical protein
MQVFHSNWLLKWSIKSLFTVNISFAYMQGLGKSGLEPRASPVSVELNAK